MGSKSNPEGKLWRELRKVERRVIRETLKQAKGSVPKAAASLGVETSQLYKRMSALGIKPSRGKSQSSQTPSP